MNRKLKIAGIAVGALLLIIIALPFLINVNSFRPTLESELTEALGRQVKVGNLGLSILSGSVTAEDLSIADDPAFSKTPFIKAKSLKVGVEVMPLIFSKTLHVTDLTLDHPEISLMRSDAGTWNFSTMGSAAKSKPPAPKSSGDSMGSTLSVAKMNVNDGRVTVSRANSSIKPHSYEKVNITVRDFSATSQFPFTISANLPGGGDVNLEGKAGPINPNDASLTPLQAKIKVKKLDLAASGFIEPSSGIAGLADFDGTLSSDGRRMVSNGTVNADKLKLSPKGAPAGRAVQVKYALDHDMQQQSGRLTQGDISMGKALAQLTGTYQMQGAATMLNMKLNGQNMPVDDLEAMLPAIGVVLPSGSSLKGGTLSTTLMIAGPSDKVVITGPVRLSNAQLAGFNLGSKMSAISALSGAKTGSDTSIENASADVRMAPEGTRTDNINLIVPSLGTVTGSGTVSPAGALDYKMNAALASGGAVSAVTQLAGIGGGGGKGGGGGIPFFIRGTTSNPSFVPDVQGMVGGQMKSAIPGMTGTSGQSTVDSLTGMFGKKKKK